MGRRRDRQQRAEPTIRLKRMPVSGWIVTVRPHPGLAGPSEQDFEIEAEAIAYAKRLSARFGWPFAYSAPRTDARE